MRSSWAKVLATRMTTISLPVEYLSWRAGVRAGPYLNVNQKSRYMPEIKATEAIPERPAVVVIFGDAGIGKTTLSSTCVNPYHLDFDKGLSRASNRGDALLPDNWEEVQEHERKGTFKKYSTICIDTAKACLDDYLMSYVVNKDYKNQKNKQAAYGALGDVFKVFVNDRRHEQADLLILAHAKDKEDGDLTKKIPDVTGGSYQLLLRIADQIGYYTTRNNRRILQFEPTDYSVGKNVARLPPIEVPDDTDPRFKTFMADIFNLVRTSIAKASQAQLEAKKKSEEYQASITASDTPDCLTAILEEVNTLPDHLKVPLRKVVQEKAKENGWVANVATKRYELPIDPKENGKPAGGPDAKVPVSKEPDPADISTPPDARYSAFGNLGMALEVDRVSGFGIFFEYDDINEWPE